MRFASLSVLSLVLSCGVASAAVLPPPTSSADAAPLDSHFSVTTKTQAPGTTLKPGKYTITIKDHLTDRIILQISDANGKVQSTFLGVFRDPLPGANGNGPVAVSGDKPVAALLGYVFAGGRSVEFVYPKAEAAALTSKTSGEILAIDPASDNLNAGKSLSKEDAQVVTLWSLQVTPVSGGEKGIAAKKYEAAPQPVVAASSYSSPSNTRTVAKREAPKAQSQSASNRTPALAALPHTASNMPLLLLVSVGALGVAFGLNTRRSALRAR